MFIFIYTHHSLHRITTNKHTLSHIHAHANTYIHVLGETESRNGHAKQGKHNKTNRRLALALSHILQREEWECFTRICETDSVGVSA